MKDPIPSSAPSVNRRDFIKGSSVATVATLLSRLDLSSQAQSTAPSSAPAAAEPTYTVRCAVIGLGNWGRDILSTLARLPQAEIVAICDTYPASLRRGKNSAPKAALVEDYRKVLEDDQVQAVILATPTHQHREIALATLAAGKHLYCEAPLATTVEDARAIAQAALKAKRLVFQSGLQTRSDPQRHFLIPFIRAGAMGRAVMARAQWHKKQSWRSVSPNPDREKELNWRLRHETSLGLIGELGIHQIDAVSWILNRRPTTVRGFGSIINWNDGREVPDTIQALFDYPGGVRLMYDATLANSFDADYEMYYGTDAAIMIRENKAWMFKEVDSPLLGWEVYARKDAFYKETGISLVANASKLNAQGENPVEQAPYSNTPLYYALENFLSNVDQVSVALEDFDAVFTNPSEADLVKYLGELALLPAAGIQEGYEATILAIKANEAIRKGQPIKFEDEWFKLS